MQSSKHVVIALAASLAFSEMAAGEESFLQPLDDDGFAAVVQFFQYDASLPLHPFVAGRSDHSDEGFTRETIVFTNPKGDRVPAWLILPTDADPPHPIVFYMEGGHGRKEALLEEGWGREYLDALLDRGVAVFALDPAFHGERKYKSDYRDSVAYNGLVNRFRDLFVDTVVDYRRAIDYLETRPELDTSRIGSYGGSMGGYLTFILAGVEPRIKAAVADTAWPWTRTFWNEVPWSHVPYQVSAIATQHYAPRIRAAFLMQMGKRDPFYTYEAGQELFRLVAAQEKDIIWYESGHDLPDEEPRTQAIRWLDKHLNLVAK